MSTHAINYGTYLLATGDFEDPQLQTRWQKGDIALVFSRVPRSGKPAGKFDLLFENGKTVFAADAELVRQHFIAVHHDPDFIIDGCSTNPGWQLAREKARS